MDCATGVRGKKWPGGEGAKRSGHMFRVGRAAREALLSLLDRVAPRIVGCTDANEIHRILVDEMRRVCAEIATQKL